MTVRPLADRVLVRPLEQEEVKKGGIIIPDTAKEKPVEGQIEETGEGRKTEEGKLIPMSVKKGDKILYGKYSGTEISLDGEDFLIMRETDILAVVQ
jgi:chaperonin GroES